MNVENIYAANKEINGYINNNNQIERNPNFIENPIYVYFEHNNKKISELIVPDPKLNLEELIKEKANYYEIERKTFFELVDKNKIDLAYKNRINQNDNYNNNKKLFYDKLNDDAVLKDKLMKDSDANTIKNKLENVESKHININSMKNKYYDIVNDVSNTANNLYNNQNDYKENNNEKNGYNFEKYSNDKKNLNPIIPKKYTTDDNLQFDKNLFEISNRSHESLNFKLIKNQNINSKIYNRKSNFYKAFQNNDSLKLNANKENELRKNTKKMNIIKNLKKAKKKNYEEEQINQETPNILNNNIDNYIQNKQSNNISNLNGNRNNLIQTINSNQDFSKQKIHENHLSDKSKDISSKSTNIYDAIKSNFKNKKDSEHFLINNNNLKEQKVNKIFNIKYDLKKNEGYKYKDKANYTNNLELLSEREKENFSMLYSLTNLNDNLFIEPTNKANNYSSNTNNYYSSSAIESKNIINSTKNSKTNLNYNYKNLNKSTLVHNSNISNTNRSKKLNFQKIKGTDKNKDNFQANKTDIYKNNLIKSNSNLNILSSFRSNLNYQPYELDSLYNTDCEILKSEKKRNLISKKVNSICSLSNLYSTRKSLFTQRKNKSLDPYSFKQSIDQSLTYKPKLNSNSIFINLRKKYSKLLEQEKEKTINSQKKDNLNSYNYSNTEDSNFNYNNKYSEDGFSKDTYNNNFYKKITKNGKIRRNKFDINYLSKTVESDVSQAKIRVKSVDEINCITNRLYNYAARYDFTKKQKEENFYHDTCPFTPSLINDVYKINNIKPSMKNFFFRLQNWVDKRNLKYETDYENTLYDNKTGEKLFSPRINSSRRYNTKRVYIFLFKNAKFTIKNFFFYLFA